MTQWSEEGYQRILDAAERGRQTQIERHKRKYEENPKICPNCEEIIPWEKKQNKFCNSSCAASYNNKKRERKRRRIQRNCKNCGNIIYYPKIYCNDICQQEYQYKDFITKWKNGEISGGIGSSYTWGVSRHIKRYLIETYGHKCSICGCEEWLGEKVPLVLDHIDGNSDNNKEENLRYVCGNCDMQLPTYKAKNIGNGREYRKQRYREGKSF